MTTLIFPLSRIEAHARVVMEEEDGKLLSAQFQAVELRGFRNFVVGTPAEQMPVIVPRICGVCSTAHHVASVKAVERVFEVTPPPLACQIREILLLGQLIQNQATSLINEARNLTSLPTTRAMPISIVESASTKPGQKLTSSRRWARERAMRQAPAVPAGIMAPRPGRR